MYISATVQIYGNKRDFNRRYMKTEYPNRSEKDFLWKSKHICYVNASSYCILVQV